MPMAPGYDHQVAVAIDGHVADDVPEAGGNPDFIGTRKPFAVGELRSVVDDRYVEPDRLGASGNALRHVPRPKKNQPVRDCLGFQVESLACMKNAGRASHMLVCTKQGHWINGHAGRFSGHGSIGFNQAFSGPQTRARLVRNLCYHQARRLF